MSNIIRLSQECHSSKSYVSILSSLGYNCEARSVGLLCLWYVLTQLSRNNYCTMLNNNLCFIVYIRRDEIQIVVAYSVRQWQLGTTLPVLGRLALSFVWIIWSLVLHFFQISLALRLSVLCSIISAEYLLIPNIVERSC